MPMLLSSRRNGYLILTENPLFLTKSKFFAIFCEILIIVNEELKVILSIF